MSFAQGKKLVKGARSLSRSAARHLGRAEVTEALGEELMQAMWRESASAASEKLLLGAGRSASAAQAASLQGQRELFRQMAPSLAQVLHPVKENVLSSGFVFEENGVLWAAVPYHVAGRAGNKVMLRLFRPDGSFVKYKVDVAVSGGYGFTSPDLSLCRLPDYARTHVTPLKLADGPVRSGEILNGFGFVVEETAYSRRTLFHPAIHWKVAETGDYNIVIPVAGESNLSGMCGSPYLNRDGQVAAVHSGSHPGRSVNAVNARNAVKDLLAAYQGASNKKNLLFNGHKVTSLAIGESIGKISVRRADRTVFTEDMQRYAHALKYDRLETVVPAVAGDNIHIEIVAHRQLVRTVKFIVW